jgi:O-antigen chain-terminating methyltransferase
MNHVKQLGKDIHVLDLGCGRGEWLELMQENNIKALGIDINAAMLEKCRAKGLKVEYCDALKFLRSAPSSTYAVITAFHLVEHLEFAQLQELVEQSLRILLPGGLLLMETPNPENITVATKNFYLDPTHQRPLPPLLLSFLPDFHGFYRSRIMRMQESVEVLQKPVTTLHDVVTGVSPDYAVIAQKAASPELEALFDDLFQTSYGVDTDTLLHRFDGHIYEVEQLSQKSSQHLHQLAEQHQKSEEHILRLSQTIQQTQQKQLDTEQRLVGLQDQLSTVQNQLDMIYLSRSWQITLPLRQAGQIVRKIYPGAKAWLTFAPMSRPHRSFCALITSAKKEISSRPRLKHAVVKISAKHPLLNRYLEKLREISTPQFEIEESDFYTKPLRQFMPPNAQQIYSDLKTAMAKKIKEQRGCE